MADREADDVGLDLVERAQMAIGDEDLHAAGRRGGQAPADVGARAAAARKALLREKITASSLVKTDSDGKPVDRPAMVNAAGFAIHLAIHMARDDAKAVLHLHTPCGQAVSAMDFGRLPHTQIAMIAGHKLAYHDYEGIATDLEERERPVADLGDRTIMLLRSHGTPTVGESIGHAFLRMYFLERGCEAQVHMPAA